jgi:S-adenosylmethionine:tRNA ribosyltransferase-isomerase
VKTSLFSFDLPEELIAQQPAPEREGARLLVVDRGTGRWMDSHVSELPRWIEPGTLLVFNDTRVRKARIFAESSGGGKSEFLLLERLGPDLWEALGAGARRMKPGKRYFFPEGITATVAGGQGDTLLLRFNGIVDEAYLEKYGHVPLPPYIRRPDTRQDAVRYQTVFSRVIGSAAAPTAGLHFTPRLMAELEKGGTSISFITLHVGLGTFLPIRSDDIEDHLMHEEPYSVPSLTAKRVGEALNQGRPIVAVGTTVVRALESAWRDGVLAEGEGKTRIFIYPGYRFRVVKRLFTNFHTPGSSLLALASAFAGRELILAAYRHAVEERYRFFSYGDAMLIQ